MGKIKDFFVSFKELPVWFWICSIVLVGYVILIFSKSSERLAWLLEPGNISIILVAIFIIFGYLLVLLLIARVLIYEQRNIGIKLHWLWGILMLALTLFVKNWGIIIFFIILLIYSSIKKRKR